MSRFIKFLLARTLASSADIAGAARDKCVGGTPHQTSDSHGCVQAFCLAWSMCMYDEVISSQL